MTHPPVRLVATDLDGTFLRHDGTPHPRVLDALDAVLDAGITVAFVTGRPPRWMAPVVEASGHRGLAVCCNGGVLVDLHAERILEVDAIPAEKVRDAVHRLRRLDPETGFALDTVEVGADISVPELATGFVHDPRYPLIWEPEGSVQVEDILDRVDERGSIVKLLARPPVTRARGDVDAWLAATREALAGVVEVTHSSYGDVLIEMSADGVTKASGLAKIAATLGVGPAEVLAVGDMPNDLPMLAWVDRGFAVANAHPTVLAAVREHVSSNDDGGVADVLWAALASHDGLTR